MNKPPPQRAAVSFAEKREAVQRLLEGKSTVAEEARRYKTQPYQLTAWIGQVMLRNPPEINHRLVRRASGDTSTRLPTLPNIEPGLGPDASDATLPDLERALGRAYLIELAKRAAAGGSATELPDILATKPKGQRK